MSDPMEGIEMNGNNNHNTGETRYENVIFKKKIGELVLSETQLMFKTKEEQDNTENVTKIVFEWKDVTKHQVSPVTYPKSLLKIILSNNSTFNNKTSSSTFQMSDRTELERIRKDITIRLQSYKQQLDSSNGSTTSPRKRNFGQMSNKVDNATFGEMDTTAMAVARSALLAANSALRQQHKYLVTETQTVTENDFWKTHQHLLEDEYARISGMAKAGTSSVLQSHLPSSGRVTLGVQEMRQIFILYPAVHKAYEEKVPLELSDEQFWRKYLESEYFHRDRGRIGTTARNHAPAELLNKENNNKKKKDQGPTYEQQEARAAAVGTDDIFSRYDQKIQEEAAERQSMQGGGDAMIRKWGKNLAVGQFDLASTFETERGQLLEGPKDNHPPNKNDDGKGSRVIQKYNRHWAMVLHPDDAVAGSNLMDVARKSVRDYVPEDPDANAQGGLDEEMRRLVDFADAPEEEANHAIGIGLHEGEEYEPLTLKNIEAYYSGKMKSGGTTNNRRNESTEEASKKHTVFANAMTAQTHAFLQSLATSKTEDNGRLPPSCFPPAALGRELLLALTKKMAKDSQTEAQSLEIVNKLPEDFRDNLQSYFRRSSELLRHFFGLRKLEASSSTMKDNNNISQKLARIVRGMETFYREMEVIRRDLPQTETGEMMRKMCLPIMDQLDWAFKLHREGSGGGGGGGFVTVEEL